jgi:hypothetical protein
MLASMGGGASTGGGLSATGVLGDILILRLFACDGSGGERAAAPGLARGWTAGNWAPALRWRMACM